MSSQQQTAGVVGSASDTAFHTFQTVSSGTRERVVVGTVGEGASFTSESVTVSTVQDPGGDLDVALFNGEQRVSPQESTATMATDELRLPAGSVYDVGSEITVELDARDRTADIDVTVVVGGTLLEQSDDHS